MNQVKMMNMKTRQKKKEVSYLVKRPKYVGCNIGLRLFFFYSLDYVTPTLISENLKKKKKKKKEFKC